ELGQPFPLIRSAYVRSNDQAAVSGTGLGLSIVYRLMEMNGGKITVSSVIGSGTDVTTWWPRQEANEQAGADAGVIPAPAISR
ncbi:MAG: ATP-binding protein, partial [Rhodospirillales bacterium]